MRKSLFVSVLLLLAVVALTATATWAYFSGFSDQLATVTTATISIGGVSNFPLSFSNLLPGESQAQEVAVMNGGDRAADMYVQMLSDGVGVNFCSPSSAIDVTIQQIGGWGGSVINTWYDASMCNLFPGWSGSSIPLIADNVPPADWAYFRVTVELIPTAGNAFQNADNSDTVHLIAVQSDGPAPIPDNDGGTSLPQAAWPADSYPNDDDPNYP